MIVLVFLICLIGMLVLYEVYETGTLQRCEYTIPCRKLTHSVTLAVCADIHGYGKNARCRTLADKIIQEQADLVLIPGDMISKSQKETWSTSVKLLGQIAEQCTVVCSLGNHDAAVQMKQSEDPLAKRFFESLNEAGVLLLDNETVSLTVRGQELSISGLTLDPCFFHRVHASTPTAQTVEKNLGKVDPTRYSILLAHTPAGSEAYDLWGADLTLSGHYHGGVLRFGKWGLITPQLKFFTDHAHGIFRNEDRYMVVTSGLGVHAIPFRVFNRPEYVVLHLEPDKESL